MCAQSFLSHLNASAFEILVNDPSIVFSTKRTNALGASMSYVSSWKLEKLRYSHRVKNLKNICVFEYKKSCL